MALVCTILAEPGASTKFLMIVTIVFLVLTLLEKKDL
jgi:hypothetical protein